MLENVKIGLFITGGIAAYKMGELTRQLIKAGAQVRVVMTASAQEFISPLTLQVLSKNKVLIDTFDESEPDQVQHIALADWLDLALIAPATANVIGKLANGIADDIVSTVLMAVNKPRVIVPAMNVKMYENPANQRNLQILAQDGYTIMEPDTGFLAEGYEGKGRLPALERIVNHVIKSYWQNQVPQVLVGKHVLVSAGGTVEAIDPVRYISNRSSGKMAYAMAQAASIFGAQVTIVSTRPQLLIPEGSRLIYVDSALEMMEALEAEFAQADYLVMAAAVSDFRMAQASSQKIKKQADDQSLILNLVENPDILATLSKQADPGQTLIGFAAETEKVKEYAQRKLVKKDIDWIIANDVSESGIGFNADENHVVLLHRDGLEIELAQGPKDQLSLEIWSEILQAQGLKKE